MSTNFTDLDTLHEMLTAAGIVHHYTPGDLVITVISGDHAWTVSEDCIIYWSDGSNVCKYRRPETAWAAEAYNYLADVYSKAQ